MFEDTDCVLSTYPQRLLLCLSIRSSVAKTSFFATFGEFLACRMTACFANGTPRLSEVFLGQSHKKGLLCSLLMVPAALKKRHQRRRAVVVTFL